MAKSAKKSAAKKRAPRAGVAAKEDTSGRVLQLTPAATLKSLLSLSSRVKRESGELAQEMSTALKNAEANKFLNKHAYAIIAKLARLDAETLAVVWELLPVYFDSAGLNERVASVPRLQFGTGDRPTEDDGEDDGEEGNGADPDNDNAAESEQAAAVL